MWSPFRHRVFTLVLLTNFFTQVALFMNALGGSWLMTDLTDSAVQISALQAAVAIPSFLLALFAGALADVASRKRIILFSQGGSLLVVVAFGVLSASDQHTPASLIVLTTLLGVMTALAGPSWIAVIPTLVDASEIPSAMTLSSAGVSVSMAVGPALGGFVIAASGPTAVFALNGVILAAGFVALALGWRPPRRTGLPPEHIPSAIRIGVQYAWYDGPIKRVIVRVVPFALASSALPALLPGLARFQLDAGPNMFGLLSAAGGLGAIITLFALNPIRRVFSPDAIVAVAMVIEAAVFIVLASVEQAGVAFIVLIAAGAANLALISTVMTALTVVLPAWIRGRGIAVYLLVLQGAFAVGAMGAGLLADAHGLQTTLYVGAAVLLFGLAATAPVRLDRLVDYDAREASFMSEPVTVTSVFDDDGPIHLVARWTIEPEQRAAFVGAMAPVAKRLRRQGALRFTLVEDVRHPGEMTETFTVATWSEYQRLPARSVAADTELHDRLMAFAGDDIPELIPHRQLRLRSGIAERDPV